MKNSLHSLAKLWSPRTLRFPKLMLMSLGFLSQLVQAQSPTIVLPQNNTSDADPYVATPCYVTGNPLASGNNVASEHVLVVAAYSASGKAHDGSGTAPHRFANADQIGGVWGIAADKPTGMIYSATVLKRHVALGPNGLGAIYVSDLNTGNATTTPMTTTKFVDLVADLGIDVGQTQVAGLNLANGSTSNAARGLPLDKTLNSLDAGVFPYIGKIGLGDLDMDETHQYLFVVNLFLKKIHKIRISNKALVSSYDIPSGSGASGTTMRPWGLEIAGGKLYAGTIYTKENPATRAAQDLTTMKAVIHQLDLTTEVWASSSVLDFPLNYPQGNTVSFSPGIGDYNVWQDNYAQWSGTGLHPQPILSDMAMDTEGALHIAIMDRAGHQLGHRNDAPDGNNPGGVTGMSGGDLLRTWNDNGTLRLENAGVAGPYTSSGTGTTRNGNGGTSAPQGPGNGEFYWAASIDAGWVLHSETSFGGVAMIRDSKQVIISIMDPIDLDAGGWSAFSTVNGSQVRDYQLYFDPSSNAFINGKANGIGDIEIVAPPLAICAITDITMTGGTSTCNDNGTPAVTTDDYFTSNVTVTFAKAPSTGNLVLTGAALHSSNTVTTVAVGSLGSTTSHTFTGVKLKANNTANALVATFSADTACTFTKNTTAVPPCSTPSCPAITVTPTPLVSGTVGTAYTANPTATGGTTSYIWTATSLPAGLSINASTGAVTGTPTAIGNATITATDANSCTGTTTLTVIGCPVYQAQTASTTIDCGIPVSKQLSASGGTGPYTWSVTTGVLPSGLTLSTTGLLSGTTTATGPVAVTITTRDSASCPGVVNLTINITPCACPVITVTPAQLPQGSVGTAYNQTPSVSGAPSGSTNTWSATGLPAGLTINTATGAVTGTPTAIGTATITATYAGPSGLVCTGTTTLPVVNNCCPQLIFSAP